MNTQVGACRGGFEALSMEAALQGAPSWPVHLAKEGEIHTHWAMETNGLIWTQSLSWTQSVMPKLCIGKNSQAHEDL